MFFNDETPRYLAKQDRWEDSKSVLCRIRQLPAGHPYLEEEFNDIAQQLQHERS